MNQLVTWIVNSVVYGTVIMYAALGEVLTEKSGHLNLGVPGMVYIGAYAGFATAFLYENTANPNVVLMVLLPLLSAILAGGLAGAIYSFFTVTLHANQNVTGLALTYLGVGLGSFGGSFLIKTQGDTYVMASETSAIFRSNINKLLMPTDIGKIFLSYGFLAYLAIVIAVLMHIIFKRTRTGLNLRAVGENPATADAAGVNVARYRYLATIIGGAIAGIGGFYYIIEANRGSWISQNNLEPLGWLAVALVIFATWRPANTIWGSYLFAFLLRLYIFLPSIVNIKLTTPVTDLLQAAPYVITIIVLLIINLRKKKENQPPLGLGINYFREER